MFLLDDMVYVGIEFGWYKFGLIDCIGVGGNWMGVWIGDGIGKGGCKLDNW